MDKLRNRLENSKAIKIFGIDIDELYSSKLNWGSSWGQVLNDKNIPYEEYEEQEEFESKRYIVVTTVVSYTEVSNSIFDFVSCYMMTTSDYIVMFDSFENDLYIYYKTKRADGSEYFDYIIEEANGNITRDLINK